MKPFKIAGWKIWYGDGTTFSSNDGPIASAPRKLILHIFYALEPNGRMSGYVLTGVEAYPFLDVGDELMAGMTVSHAKYQETLQDAARALNHGTERLR